jgi:hypothetical protein
MHQLAKSPNNRGQAKPSTLDQALRPRSSTTPSSHLSHTTLERCTTSPSWPLEGQGGIELSWAYPLWQEQQCRTNLARTEGIAITSAWSDAIPVPRRTDEPTLHGSNNGYDTHHPNTDRQDACMIPPTTGWDPWQAYQHIGHPDWWSAPTPTIGVVALSPAKPPSERRHRAVTYFGYDAPGN